MKNLENYKKYITKQMELTSKLLQPKEADMKKLPTLETIKLEKYGTKKDLLKKYFPKNNPLKNIFLHRKYENFIKKSIIIELRFKKVKEIQKLKEKYRELNEISQSIVDNEFTKPLFPNKIFATTIFQYAKENNISARDIIDIFLTVFKLNTATIPTRDTEIEYSIQKTLSDFFDIDSKLKSGIDYQTFNFVFHKFLTIEKIDTKDPFIKNLIHMIEREIKNQVKLNEEISNKELRNKLETEKKSYQELSNYLKGTHIIKVCDIKKFEKLLQQASFTKEVKEILITAMKESLKKEEHHQELNNVINVLSDLSGEDSLETLKSALTILEDDKDNELYCVIKDYYHSIISMVKYMKYSQSAEEVTFLIESISEKIFELKSAILISKDALTIETEELFYLLDKNNLPYLYKDIEILDILYYPNVTELIERAFSNHLIPTAELSTENNITIYESINDAIKLTYAEKDNIIVLIGISHIEANDKISKRLSERDFFEHLSSYYDALESVNNVRIKNIYLSKLIKVLLNPQILEEEPELLHTFKVKK